MLEKEEQLNRLAQELFDEHTSSLGEFIPSYPWVLVRVLPRERKTASGIVLLDTKTTSSVVYEGIVLKTWKPFTRLYKTKSGEDSQYEVKSECLPGDHVMFNHWTGMPLAGLLPDEYRLIPERTEKTKGLESNCLIMGKIERHEKSVKDKLISFLDDLLVSFLDDYEDQADLLLEHFDIIPKDVETVLSPGRSRE